MENPEEILHSLEEFSKMKPKDIPRELEEYLCFVAKTGNPVYQWPIIKSLFREKLINVITEFYESCPTMDIPPCPNVEMFNYDMMKNFILEKLDTFAAAPFTVQRISELLTTPRKEYSRIDKYMRALEKNILVVSTVEPGRRSTENGEDGIMNGIESEHLPESSNSSHDINIEDMDESPSSWSRHDQVMPVLYKNGESEDLAKNKVEPVIEPAPSFETDQEAKPEIPSSSTAEEPKPIPQETAVITCTSTEETIEAYVSIEPQETSYQNLSEESSSNSSDSSSSVSALETKETASSEGKDITEDIPEVKVETIVPKEDQEKIQTPEPIITEPEPEPKEPPSEETQLEISHPEIEKEPLPETPNEDISTEEVTSKTHETEVPPLPETTSEAAEEKLETEEKELCFLVEQKEDDKEKIEDQIVPETPASVPQESENIVDSSTDGIKEEECAAENSPKQVTEPEKTETNEVEVANSDVAVADTKEQSEESPMEVDINEDKKVEETEEPSSSVEPFVA